MTYQLVVGAEDVTSYVTNGATFSEVASSATSGGAHFALTGVHAAVVVGAPITLTINGVVAWEGSVQNTQQVVFPSGAISTTVSGIPSNAALNISTEYSTTTAADAADVASKLAAQAGLTWGGPSSYGLSVGTLALKNLGRGVEIVSAIAEAAWSVRNGALVFVNKNAQTPTALSTPATVVPNTATSVTVTGGIDATSRQPLQGVFTPIGAPQGPNTHTSTPEISDTPTLQLYGQTLANRYGSQSVIGTITIPSTTVVIRAGDVVVDSTGAIYQTTATNYTLVAGQYTAAFSVGHEALSPVPVYDSALFQASTQFPVVRVHDGYVVQGADLSVSGLVATVSAGTVVIAGQTYVLTQSSLPLAVNSSVLIIATSTGYAIDTTPLTPYPGDALGLYAVTTDANGVVGSVDVRTHGSMGLSNVQSNVYPAPVTTSPTGDAVDGISGLTTDVTVTATFTNIPTENTAAEIAWYFRTAGGTTWSLWGSTAIPGLPQPVSTQTLSFDYTALPNGGAFDFGAAYKGLRSDTGPIAVVLSNFATGALAVPSGDGPPMPSTIKTNGPTITSSSLGAAVGLGSGSFAQPFTVSVGDWTAGNNPTWFVELLFYKREHGDTNAIPVGAITANKTGLSYTSTADLPASSTGWDIGVAYLDAAGEASTIVWPTALNAVGAPLQPPAIATGSYPTPTTSSVSVTIEGVSPASCDVIVTPVFTNIPASPANGIHWYARTSGTTAWGLRGVTSLSTSSFKFAALVNGAEYDFGAAYGGLRSDDVGTIAVLESNVVASNIANEFSGSLNSDGSWSNVDGHSTSTQYTIGSGQPTIIQGEIQRGVTTSFGQLLLGNQTNGYGIGIDDSGDVFLAKYIAGTYTNLGAVLGVFNDTNPHSYRLTISNSGGTNNIEGTIDQHALAIQDVLTNVWNPADKNASMTLSGSNLVATTTASSTWVGVRGLFGMSSGKWYWENKITAGGSDGGIGVGTTAASLGNIVGGDAYGWGYSAGSGFAGNNGAFVAYGATWGVGDVIGVALDMTDGTLTFYKNGVSQGVAFTGLTGTLYPMLSLFDASGSATANFGATAFAYTPPTGYSALNELTNQTWPVTVYTGGNAGKLSHYAFAATPSHFGGLPGVVTPLIRAPWDAGYADGSNLNSGVITARHILGNSSTDTSNVTQDKISDGTTYARVKGTELTTGFVHQLNDGTNIRTAGNVAALINANSSVNSSNGNLLPNSDFSLAANACASPNTGTRPPYWLPYNNAGAAFNYSLDNTDFGAPPCGNAWRITNQSGANTTSTMGLYAGTANIDGSANQILYANKTYVFSFYAAATSANMIFVAAANAGVTVSALAGFPQQYNDVLWHRYAFLFTVGTANYQGGVFASLSPTTPVPNNGSVAFCGFQLEEGSICSAWSGPSPSGGTMIDFALPHPSKGALALKNQANLPTDVVGLLPYANHATTIQNRGAGMHISCAGQMPYIDSSNVLHFPSNVIFFRPNGDFCRIDAGTTVSVGAWEVVFIDWVSQGVSPAYTVAYNASDYQYVFNEANGQNYEIVGYINGDGAQLLFHAPWLNASHFSGMQNTLDVSGNLKSSTAFQTNTPSLPPFTTNMNMWLYSPTGATYIWVYITSGATQTTVAGTMWLSNNTSISVPAYSHQFTGLVVGDTYYSGATFDPVAGTWTVISPQTTPLSYAQLQSLFTDGYQVFQSSATIAAGNGTSTGGAGCPAVGQIIETKEAGFIPAECVRTGYHVRHPDGGWREVLHAGAPTPATIYAVTFDSETIYVDSSHLFEKTLGTNQWVNVRELQRGDRFQGARGRSDLVVQHISKPLRGHFIPLHVDGYRYTLGQTISHNIKVN